MSEQERRLAEYLKRAVPEPPVWLSPEEITVPKAERSRRSWAIPILAAAAVVAIGVAISVVATHHPVTRPPAASSAADQSGSSPAGTPSAQPTASCQARGASVTVPSVVGLNYSQASQILQRAGFAVGIRALSSTAPGGTVIGQSPASGSQLARGAMIELTASGNTANWRHFFSKAQVAAPPGCPASAPPSATPSTGAAGAAVAVPSVIGMAQDQATQVLQAAGFDVIVRAEAPVGQSVPAGVVWSQSVPGGAEAARGTKVMIDVAPK